MAGRRFHDRQDAGRRLAAELRAYAPEHPIVLALPRGGVPVGLEVARELSAPLDVWVVRKVGVPWYPELGAGAVAEGGHVYLSQEILDYVGLTADALSHAVEAKRHEVEQRVRRFRGEQPRPILRDRTVIVVDDGIATGGTVRAVIESVRAEGAKKIVLAVPVATPDVVRMLEPQVDRVVCLLTPVDLQGISLWYDDFAQLSDDEVVGLLDRARAEQPVSKPSEGERGAAAVSTPDTPPVTILLAGDVMTGRGVDQILPHPSSPELREVWAETATAYVELARQAHGPIPAPVDPSYVWGDALEALDREKPAASIVNLETSITMSNEFWPGKAVHYRMHPDNVACLRAAHLDLCVLANNHALDFGVDGLLETIDVLRDASIGSVGAGRDLEQASRPAYLDLGHGARLLVFAFGSTSSGIPREWAATPSSPGIRLLDDLSTRTADEIIDRVHASRRPGDLVLASIHWGSNWGYDVDPQQVAFAHRLVDGGVDLVHGHSSHHVRPIEVHRGRLVLYGCGDLVSDYEGIGGNEPWRGELGAIYLATIPAVGSSRLRMIPTRMRRFRLTRTEHADATWLRDRLNEISRRFGARFELTEDGALILAEGGADRATRRA